jgi:hypothetical protein
VTCKTLKPDPDQIGFFYVLFLCSFFNDNSESGVKGEMKVLTKVCEKYACINRKGYKNREQLKGLTGTITGST